MSSLTSPVTKGNIGEKYVEKYLRKNGYKIIRRNMRNRFSEIDIIAENREYIIFVEVKTRTEGQLVTPSAAVNKTKQHKIILSAYGYINMSNIKKQPRFDVAEVFLAKEKLKPKSLNYIENAFSQGGKYAVF